MKMFWISLEVAGSPVKTNKILKWPWGEESLPAILCHKLVACIHYNIILSSVYFPMTNYIPKVRDAVSVSIG